MTDDHTTPGDAPPNDTVPTAPDERSDGPAPEAVTPGELLEAVADGSVSGRWADRAVAGLLQRDPGDDDLSRLGTGLGECLGDDSESVRIAAAAALARLASARPDAVTEASTVSALVAATDDASMPVRNYAANAVSLLAGAEPDALGDAVADLALADAPLNVRQRLAEALAAVGEVAPEAVRPLVPDLVAVVGDVDGGPAEGDPGPGGDADQTRSVVDGAVRSDRGAPATGGTDGTAPTPVGIDDQLRARHEETAGGSVRFHLGREQAALALARVAGGAPDAVADHADTLARTVARDDVVGTREAVLEALAAVAETAPDAVPLDPIAAVVSGTDRPELGAAAARVLAALAESHPDAVADAVEPSLDAVVELCRADAPDVRGAGAGLLSYVAERRPEAVRPAVPAVVELLDDEAAYVRGSAVWTLRFVGGESAREALRAAARDDPDEEVRTLAAHALEALGG